MPKFIPKGIKKNWQSRFSSAKFKLKFFFIGCLRRLRSNKISLFLRRFIGASKILSTWERRLVFFLLLVFVLGSIFFIREKYIARTQVAPDFGGVYVEGIVGQPSQINPIFASSDTDRAISSLVFRGLTKLGPNKKIVSDIAKYRVSSDGLEYTFTIKKDVFWHDGQEVIADDVLFTISLIQDPEYTGPYAGMWDNAEAYKIDDKKLVIELAEPHAPFLESTTIGILPSYILGGLSVEDIKESEFSASPIGCGPYKIIRSMSPREKSITSLSLERFDKFYDKDIKIEKITFNFYKNWKEVVAAFEKGEITGISNLAPDKEKYFTTEKDLVKHKFNISQYMALFFNTKRSQIRNHNLRLAITKGISKKTIFKVYGGEGRIIESPILPGTTGYRALRDYRHSTKEAQEMIEKEGYKKDKQGIYKKGKYKLSFSLVTNNNSIDIKIAEAIKDQLRDVGISIKIISLPLSNLQAEYIIPRKYDLLLIGINSGLDPDPYPFWHSSQADGEGLNLSRISDSKIDNLLSEARTTLISSERGRKYQEFAELLHEKIAAVLLYQPDYIFGTNRAMRGIRSNWLVSGADRFFFIDDWYIKTKRIGK